MDNKDYMEKAHLLELKAEAIKGLARIGEYFVASDCADAEVVDAIRAISKWINKDE